jgi:hypothetical protein
MYFLPTHTELKWRRDFFGLAWSRISISWSFPTGSTCLLFGVAPIPYNVILLRCWRSLLYTALCLWVLPTTFFCGIFSIKNALQCCCELSHIRSERELWSHNSRPLLGNGGMVFSAQSVPMAAHATVEYVMPSLSNSCCATEERCFLRGPCRDVISRTLRSQMVTWRGGGF